MNYYNTPLKLKIVEYYRTQKAFSKAVGTDPAVISGVIRGWRLLPKEDQKQWAKALKCRLEDIFKKE